MHATGHSKVESLRPSGAYHRPPGEPDIGRAALAFPLNLGPLSIVSIPNVANSSSVPKWARRQQSLLLELWLQAPYGSLGGDKVAEGIVADCPVAPARAN